MLPPSHHTAFTETFTEHSLKQLSMCQTAVNVASGQRAAVQSRFRPNALYVLLTHIYIYNIYIYCIISIRVNAGLVEGLSRETRKLPLYITILLIYPIYSSPDALESTPTAFFCHPSAPPLTSTPPPAFAARADSDLP